MLINKEIHVITMGKYLLPVKVLQASWSSQNSLIFWGEKSPESSEDFTLSTEELLGMIESLEYDAQCSGQAKIIVPFGKNGPIVSPQLFAPCDSKVDRMEVLHVPTVELDALSSLSFLTSLPNELPVGLQIGVSIKYWVDVTKMLLDLLTRGKFFPKLSPHNEMYIAHWEYIAFDSNDRARIETLSRKMPPICRALIADEIKSPLEANFIVESFLSTGCEVLVRTFLKSFLQPIDIHPSELTPPTKAALSWYDALYSLSGKVEGSVYHLSELEQKLKRWSSKVVPSSGRDSLRILLKLEELTEDEEEVENSRWRLEFFLQSVVDKNNLISAEELWKGELGFLEKSDYSFSEVEEILLRGLGIASEYVPSIYSSLESPYPATVEFGPRELYHYLKESSVILEQSGFGIENPAWWNERGETVGLHLDIDSPMVNQLSGGSQRLGLKQLVDYSWRVAVGDKVFTVEEFKELVADQLPLTKIGGQWVELSPERVGATVEFLEGHSDKGNIALIEALKMGLSGFSGDKTLPVTGFSASGWVEKLLLSDSSSLEAVETPKGFNGDLRPYQIEGVTWMSFLNEIGIGCCLADDMGLGKTVQLIALLLREKELREAANDLTKKPILLFAPMSIIDNWEREVATFSNNIKTYIHHGPERHTGKDFIEATSSTDLVLSTYSLAHRDEALFKQVGWDKIILDEAQNIKNISSKQTKAVRAIAEAHPASGTCQHIALTGTPLENHLEELWSIFDFLNAGLLGGLSEFRSKFSVPIEKYRDNSAAEQLARVVRPFLLRRLKSDPKIISDLPEKIEMDVLTVLTDEQAALYQSVLDSMLEDVDKADGIHRKGIVLSLITKLKQICNHPALYLKDKSELADRSGKLSRLEQLLEVILAEKDKVLIFTQYAQMGHLLKTYLQDKFKQEVLFLHGSLSKKKRLELIDKFQTDEGPPIFLLSLKAGGYGLNLTAARQVIHFDQWWNPATHDQATDRAHRIGQKNKVQVRKFICNGTLEERISELLAHKKQLADTVVTSTKSMITQMSTNELKKLLELSVNLEMGQKDSKESQMQAPVL